MTVEQMADDDYFAFDAVDQTALKKYLVSPLAYSQYLTGEHSSSPQFEFGKAAHSLILGSGPEVLVKPNLRTKEGKARYAETLKLHEGEDIVWLSPMMWRRSRPCGTWLEISSRSWMVSRRWR